MATHQPFKSQPDIHQGHIPANPSPEPAHPCMSGDAMHIHAQDAPQVLTADQQKIWDAASAKDAHDPLGALLRSTEARAKFLADSWDSTRAADYSGKDPAAVHAYAKELKLSSFIHEGEHRYPAWQFSNGRVVPGPDQILPFLPVNQSALATAGFFTNDQFIDLFINGQRVSPATWLWSGRAPNDVAVIARHLEINL